MTEKVVITHEKITPEIASRILEQNYKGNRGISLQRVQMYEHDMLSGAWMDNGETIKIDKDGNLIDGQHRLKAVQKSGTTQWMWVARGLAADAFQTIDVGYNRTPRQIFRMSGDPLKQHKTASALAGFSFRALRGIPKGTSNQLAEFVESNRENMEWLYNTITSAERVSGYYLLTAIAMHLHGVPDSEIDWFIEGAYRCHFDPKKSADAFKYCVQAERVRQSAKSITFDTFASFTRCAYSYVGAFSRMSQKEIPYPIQMDDKYKIVRG